MAVGHTQGFLLVENGKGLLDQTTVRDFVLRLLNGLFCNGETAVMVFFVISGVVIGRSLDVRQGSTTVASDYIAFIIRRVFRLYPANIVTIFGIILLAFLFLAAPSPIDFAAFPGTTPAIHHHVANLLNGELYKPLKWTSIISNLAMVNWSMNWVAWSLYIEVCAIPLLPLFHYLSRKYNLKLDLAILVALTFLSWLLWEKVFWLRFMYIFYLGMIVESHGLVVARAFERLVGSRMAVLMLFLIMTFPNTFHSERFAWVVFAEAVSAFGIISLIVFSEQKKVPLAFRSLEHPILRWNGRLSYSFYLWHFIILTISIRAIYAMLPFETINRFDLPLVAATSIVTIAIALGIAQLSYNYVELPSIKLGRMVAAIWRRRTVTT